SPQRGRIGIARHGPGLAADNAAMLWADVIIVDRVTAHAALVELGAMGGVARRTRRRTWDGSPGGRSSRHRNHGKTEESDEGTRNRDFHHSSHADSCVSVIAIGALTVRTSSVEMPMAERSCAAGTTSGPGPGPTPGSGWG